MSDKIDNFENTFRRLELEADVAIHLHSKENRKALKVLRELRPLQSNQDVVAKIYFMTMESECHLRLEEYSAASEVSHEIEKLLTTSNVMPDDVNTMAKKFKDKNLYSRAYIAFYAACKLYLIKSANDAASKINLAFGDMKIMSGEMAKFTDDKNTLKKHMFPAMKKVVEELVAMPDNGSHEKVENQAWCYSCIARCYSYVGDKEQDIAMNEAAISHMKEKLCDDAEKYKVTGLSFNNAGVAYHNLGLKHKAISAIKSAIRIKEKATDYFNEKEREKDVEFSRSNLKRLEEK